MTVDRYRQFLETKIKMAPRTGFEVSEDEINPALQPHQRDIVRWGVAGGRRAYFARFGLGKTVMELETSRLILERAGGRGLIVMPQDVRIEFRDDARNILGWSTVPEFIRRIEDADETGLYLTNYETIREGKLDPAEFTVASLDEAAVLRSYGSKTYQEFLPLFEDVRFRYVATALPSPNRYKELIHYAGFLGIMDTGQALTRFFQRNSTKAGDLTLYPHKTREFFLWLNSWAIFLQQPSDLGHSDEGYILPELIVRWHEVKVDIADAGADDDGQLRLMRDAAVGLQATAREKRNTLSKRIEKLVEIRSASPADHFILWHDLEDERRAIEAALPQSRSVYGTQDPDEREQTIVGFKAGEITDLAAKPVMLGAGGNLQRHCHRAIYAGIGHKFHDFLQSVHRLQRYGQRYPVEIDLIYAETEREVRRDLERKWAQDRELRETMSALIKEHGLDKLSGFDVLTRSIGIDRQEASGENWRVANNDCVDETRRMATNSVDLVVTSIPFGTQYEYCASYNDFGHNDDNAGFFRQMDFLTPELLRVLKPGRVACVHVKDRIQFGSVTGTGRYTVEPFHADTIEHFRAHGFLYMGMRVITTDVVRENNQTYRLSYGEMLKDATKMGAGSQEFVLMFCKPQSDRSRGYADDPVIKTAEEYGLARWQIDAHGYWQSSGNRLLAPDEWQALAGRKGGMQAIIARWREENLATVYDYGRHVEVAEALASIDALPKTYMAVPPHSADPSVWTDINRMLTLNTDQAAKGREQHVCPLQFDIVDRLIDLYSMRGELVYDPFAGIGTVPYRAVLRGRLGAGAELEAKYWRDSIRYLEAADRQLAVPSLFDLLTSEEAA
mgnify:CR=1 FL=1